MACAAGEPMPAKQRQKIDPLFTLAQPGAELTHAGESHHRECRHHRTEDEVRSKARGIRAEVRTEGNGESGVTAKPHSQTVVEQFAQQRTDGPSDRADRTYHTQHVLALPACLQNLPAIST